MRKLNQPGRPKAVPCSIPRPPTPPQSVQVQTLKGILLSNQQQMRHRNQSNNTNSNSNIINNTSNTTASSNSNSSNPSTVVVTHQQGSTPVVLNGHLNHSSYNSNSNHHHHHQPHQHHFSQPQNQPFNSQAPSLNKSHLNNSHTLCPQSMNQHQASRNSLLLESSHITSTNTCGTSNTASPHNGINSSSSSNGSNNNTIDSPGDAIEPNCDFPAPPDEFLEDIRANRKQEEIEGPLEASPSVTPPDSIASSDIAIDLSQDLQRNSHSFNGHGSLNSSITETETTESSSWSPSPTASPLASPSHSSWESASIQSFTYPASSSSSTSHHHHHHHSSPSRFPFPPPQVQAALITNKPPQPGVTLAPLLPCNLDREPIYQRLPTLARPGSSLSTASTSSSLSSSHLPSTSGPTGTIARPPDYQTAMKRLSLAKANSTLHRPNPASTISHSMASVVSLHAQNITGPTITSSPSSSSLPLKAGPQFVVPSVPVATVNPHRPPPSPPPVSRNSAGATTTKTALAPRQMVNGGACKGLPGGEVNGASSLVNGPPYNRATNSGPSDEIPSSRVESGSIHDLLLDQHSPLPPKAVQSTSTTGKSTSTTTPTGNAIGGTSNFSLSSSHLNSHCPLSPNLNPPSATGGGIMKKKVKKRVSFSDQVELVCSEEMIQEEHLPNPVLERVLGKAFLQNNHINNG